mgnify:CR=1 FL=1
MATLYAVIASGQQVSGNLDLSQYNRPVAIAVPVVTSGDLLVRGSFTTTSADFVRLQASRPNTDIRFATGLGSNMVLWPSDLPAPPYLRLEIPVAQADVRTLTMLVR